MGLRKKSRLEVLLEIASIFIPDTDMVTSTRVCGNKVILSAKEFDSIQAHLLVEIYVAANARKMRNVNVTWGEIGKEEMEILVLTDDELAEFREKHPFNPELSARNDIREFGCSADS